MGRVRERTCSKLGITVAGMKGDGNCQFRAIADQLFGDQSLHWLVRKWICHYILENRDYFAPFCPEGVDTFVQQMAKNRVWGNAVTAYAARRLFGRPIELLVFDAKNG